MIGPCFQIPVGIYDHDFDLFLVLKIGISIVESSKI